ncbi:hypothetical protein FOCC_FOCC000781 [Frankliniella occidentalis]|uniref:LITAF domain-containing protein-like n=1 Tax=Frankliniella occidentalis TaxID=133901 RepID=A0A6J1S2X2_FRAOC|nr:LITAF domain-containing protein-like [Frankliniella occidentalis]KAE8752659.1 hypothetical protein FOCC_FOCC000781 [Frankliniella occidentalis]
MGNPGEPYPGNPPPSYPGAMPAPPMVTVITAAAVGPEPTRLTCPHCHSQVTTNVEHSSNSRTHLFALLLCLICPLGCCFIPYCTNSCMAAAHSCPVCHQHLGTYER